MPTDIRVALEAMHDDVTCFAADRREVDLSALRIILLRIVASLRDGLGEARDHADMVPVLAEVNSADSGDPSVVDLTPVSSVGRPRCRPRRHPSRNIRDPRGPHVHCRAARAIRGSSRLLRKMSATAIAV